MLKKSVIYIFLYSAFFYSMLNGDLIKPSNNSVLNYVHVLFEWEQVPDAIEYRLQISIDNNFSTIVSDTIISSLVFIDKNNIEWSSDYFLRIKPIYIGQESTWSDASTFSTAAKRSNATAIIYNDLEASSGLTIFGSFLNKSCTNF